MAAPQLTWANIVITVGAAVALASLGASVVQYQFAGINERVTKVDTDSIARDRDAKHDRELKDQEVAKKFDMTDAELLRRAELFLTVKEFVEFKARMIDRATVSEKRLNTIEQTRPTAETLRAVADGAKDTIGKLEERIRTLEGAPRAPAIVPAR